MISPVCVSEEGATPEKARASPVECGPKPAETPEHPTTGLAAEEPQEEDHDRLAGSELMQKLRERRKSMEKLTKKQSHWRESFERVDSSTVGDGKFNLQQLATFLRQNPEECVQVNLPRAAANDDLETAVELLKSIFPANYLDENGCLTLDGWCRSFQQREERRRRLLLRSKSSST